LDYIHFFSFIVRHPALLGSNPKETSHFSHRVVIMVDSTASANNGGGGGDLSATFRAKASFMKGWKPASTPSVRP
jgi:hypothetical protein